MDQEVEVITDKRQAFIDFLFGAAEGDPAKARDMAEYSPNTKPSNIMAEIQNAIIERAKMELTLHSPKAVTKLVNMLDGDLDPMTKERLMVIKEVLDRAGLIKKEQGAFAGAEIQAIVLLPPKDVIDDDRDTSVSVED